MTVKQLKEWIIKLAKPYNKQALTLDERMANEYFKGYNKAIVDIILLLDEVKNQSKNGHQEENKPDSEGGA
jgi:hypothetical protein